MNFKRESIIVSAKDVNLHYGNKKILSNVNFSIEDIVRPGFTQGQICALVGRSGIGKTQLFRLMAGLNQPSSGQILIGKEQSPVRLGQVGVVTQQYALLEHRTVKKNLQLSGAKDSDIKAYCDEFDLSQHMDKYPAQLSGGQRQRTAILQQILRGNSYILMDEPFSGLDPLMVKKTINLLLKISLLDELTTIIIVSHDLVNCTAISDTIFLMTKKSEEEGASIQYKYDLADMGLTWDPEIRKEKKFWEVIEDIEAKM